MSRKKTTDEFMNEVKFKNGYDLDLTNFVYGGRDTKSLVRCKVCGYEWETTPRVLLGNHGCPICNIKNGHAKMRSSQDDVVQKLLEIYGDKYDFSKVEYVNARTKIEVVCKKHGSFFTMPHDLFNLHGCPYCRQSRGEQMVKRALENGGMEFVQQHSFEWMKLSTYGKLSYDFYIPSKNIAIECQGRQHFEVVSAFGGEETFLKTIERDKKKKELTKEHGIELIYFLEKRFNKYMTDDYKHFNDTEELMKYLQCQKP